MAEVSTPTIASNKADVKKKKIFGEQKKPDLIIYRLIKENNVSMRQDTPRFPPYKRFPNYDIITWEFTNEDGSKSLGTRAIRWLPGFGSIFVDEQEANNRVIPKEVLENPNNRFEIIDGEIKIRPHERTKIQFLDYCNRNADSPYRTGNVEGLFKRVSEEQKIEELSLKQEKQKEAVEKAFSADENQIAFHARYLDIPLTDASTSESRTFKAIETDYRQKAFDDPVFFLKTYDDEDLKLKYKIGAALENGVISTSIMQGRAVYSATKEEICDVPVGDAKQVIDTLFLFSQTSKGSVFLKKMADVIK